MSVEFWPRSRNALGTHKLDTVFEIVDRKYLVKAARRTPYLARSSQRYAGPFGQGWWAETKEVVGKVKQKKLIASLGLTTCYGNFLALTKHHAVPKGSPLLTHDDDADDVPHVDAFLQMLVTARCVAPDRYELIEVYFGHRCVDFAAYGDLFYCGSAVSRRVTSRAFCSGHDVRSWLICGPALRGPMTLCDEATVIEMGKESVPEICHQMSPRKVFPLDDDQVRYVSQITDTKNPLYNMHLTAPGETATNWVAERTARHKLTGDDLAEHAREVMQHKTREQWRAKSEKAGGSKTTHGKGMKGPAKVKHTTKSVAAMKKYENLPAKARARAKAAAQKKGHAAAKNKPCRCGSTTHNRMSHRECRFYGMVLTDHEKKKGKPRDERYENEPRCYECP
jgi:hypothetical protein